MNPELRFTIFMCYFMITMCIYLWKIFGSYSYNPPNPFYYLFWPITLIINPIISFINNKWDEALIVDEIDKDTLYASFWKKKLFNEWVISTNKDGRNTHYEYYKTKAEAELIWITLKV